jgi:DNA-directed RNA polymerase specialized sigma subunit, sigma54 homolog
VRDYLPELGAQHLPERLRRLGLREDAWLAAKKLILSLDPRPGAKYASERTVGVVPDVEIVEREDAPGFEARLLDDGLPRLRISRRYEEMLENPKPARKPSPSSAKKSARASS